MKELKFVEIYFTSQDSICKFGTFNTSKHQVVTENINYATYLAE